MNMFKPVKATTVDEYLDQLPQERKEAVQKLHEFILQSAPSLRPHFAHNMLGYGSFKYKNYKGEIIVWPTIALASQKNYISIYVCAVENGEYLAEKYQDSLGKVSVGKSCIRIKKIDDVDMKELGKVIKLAEKSPGLPGRS